MKRKSLLFMACIVGLLFTISTSACLRGPQRRPQQDGGLKTGPMQPEPTISLYVADKAQKTSVKIEQYLEGVVAAEMGTDAPPEALAAQAIIARTFTIQRIEEKGGTRQTRGTDASTDKDEFQAYDASKVNDAVRAAVKATRGIVITYQGKPALTWFHANSGGKTATPEEGLNFTERPVPYIVSTVDPVPNPDPWNLSISKSEFASAVKKLGKAATGVKSVSIAKKGPSGRATEIKVDSVTVPAAELRTQIGADKMRSTLLDSIAVSGDKVVMKGKGWGHGVGMSQNGARAMAQQGRKAADIIAHYYKGVTLERRWQ